jgi:nitroreductase
MNKVGFFDLLLKRRSIRDFQEENISLEIIDEIIRDSCYAPSSENTQPWKFVIIGTGYLLGTFRS